MKNKSITKLAAGLAGAVLVGGSAQAATFAYNPTDLLLGFRNGGANDFVVDLGPISSWYVYSSLQPNTTYNITAYNGSQLTSVFGTLDNISFSAFADVRTVSNPKFPNNTLFTTAPRLDINVQSDPLNRRSTFAQGTTGGKIDGIANGAITFSGLPDNTGVSTATALEMPSDWTAGGFASYTKGVGAAGNFGGTFPASVENTTPSGFATGGTPIVSDLYSLLPDSGGSQGDYLGSFVFSPDGSTSFHTVPEPGSMSLLGAGFALIGLASYFRRKP